MFSSKQGAPGPTGYDGQQGRQGLKGDMVRELTIRTIRKEFNKSPLPLRTFQLRRFLEL